MSSNVADVLVASAVSSGAVAGMAAGCGQAEGQSRWKPINAISHIVWGPLAAARTGFTWRYTGLGLLLNGAACGFWAVVYQAGRRSFEKPDSVRVLAGASLAVSAMAYLTDYYMVPSRFSPGFELTLTRRSFPWLYGALAAGLFASGLIARHRPAGGNPRRHP